MKSPLHQRVLMANPLEFEYMNRIDLNTLPNLACFLLVTFKKKGRWLRALYIINWKTPSGNRLSSLIAQSSTCINYCLKVKK
jgi:hypothetical protein